MCLARFGSPATACVDQAEDLSPQSSPFRDAWIGKDVRNKRVSDRVLFPSPAPLHLEIPFQVQPFSVGSPISANGSVPVLCHECPAQALETLNGLFQAARRRARGFASFDTITTVIFLIAGKLDFAAANPHAQQPTQNSVEPLLNFSPTAHTHAAAGRRL